MFGAAFLIALAFSLIAGLLDLIPTGGDRNHVSTVLGVIVTIVVLVPLNWLILYVGTPSLTGVGYAGIILPNVIITGIIFGIVGAVDDRVFSAALGLMIVVFVIYGIFGIANAWNPRSQAGATTLAKTVKVVKEDPSAYPPTDDNHMLVVSDQAALYEATQALNSGAAAQKNIATFYELGDGVLQSVDGHLYYLFPLQLKGYKNQDALHNVVPGYMAVDAEDPNVPAVAKLGYKMLYNPGAPHQYSIRRLLFNNGYSHYFVDDLTLEVNDQWQPFYTASINKSPLGFAPAVPKAMVIIDPQTGKIERHGLNDVPDWVDRIYSQSVVTDMLNWWGKWGAGPSKAPFSIVNQGSGNRYQVSGDPQLVYTTGGHPVWQALLTSLHGDTTVNYIALFDGRDNSVRLYNPDGPMAIESAVSHAFSSSQKNLKGLDPVGLTLHKIYGTLTWVVSFVPNGSANNGNPEPFSGIGLMQASDTNGANVILSTTKADALNQYQALLAQGDQNQTPGENSAIKTVTGTIAQIKPLDSGGTTSFYLELNGDSAHYYVGTATTTNVELVFAQAGDSVTITYLDTGSTQRNVSSFDDATQSLK